MYKVIVTGFDPFDKMKINPSMEIVNLLKDFEDFKIYPLVLPTVYEKCSSILINKIEEVNPDLVISFGVASGRKKIALERFALNIDDAKCRDNSGDKRKGIPVDIDGPLAYQSGLPLDGILKNLRKYKIKSYISNFCGTFVCNHIMYSLLHYISKHNLNIKYGFIHVPKMARGKKSKFMSLDKMVKAAEIIMKTSIINIKDK